MLPDLHQRFKIKTVLIPQDENRYTHIGDQDVLLLKNFPTLSDKMIQVKFVVIDQLMS